jgi:hypothetical protein
MNHFAYLGRVYHFINVEPINALRIIHLQVGKIFNFKISKLGVFDPEVFVQAYWLINELLN